MKVTSAFIFLSILAFASSCGWLKSVTGPERDTSDSAADNPLNVPCHVKNSRFEEQLYQESAFVIDLPSEQSILLGENQITKSELEDKLKSLPVDSQERYRKIIFIRADAEIGYGSLIDVLDAVRNGIVQNIALVVCTEGVSSYQYRVLDVKTAAPESDAYPSKPDPLKLFVSIGEDGIIKLNSEPQASLESLSAKLREVFNYREISGTFIEGTQEVEKRVHLKIPTSKKYTEVLQILDAAADSGASLLIQLPVPRDTRDK